ncbi:MAG: DUF2069 domain-containing protein [Arenimonas sp.]|nr:DUF2069 domain-containing protein [Arenimonas sp.]MBP6627373.1 DUF2069 domain-containing protein [Arenimonas sp.]
MSRASRIAATALLALTGLQWLWHGWLAPPASVPAWAMATTFTLPLVPALLLLLLGHRRAGFWGALAALVYFSHGVMAAWASPDVRWLALAQAALSATLVVAASWDGVSARFRKRAAAPPL